MLKATPSSPVRSATAKFVQSAAVRKPQTEAEWLALANQTLGGSQSSEDLFAVMMMYPRLTAKERREEAKMASTANKLSLTMKPGSMGGIDEAMKEARAKADIAMTAATTGMVIGVVSGLVQIGAAAAAGDAGAPDAGSLASTPGTSILEAAVRADVAAGDKLSTAAREEIRAGRVDMLDAIAKSWETKSSVTAAIRARAAQNGTLAKESFAYVLPCAVYDAYEEALSALDRSIDAVKRAPNDRAAKAAQERAALRARLAIETLRVVTQSL